MVCLLYTSFSIVGLGDTAISESKDRVRTALKNSDFKMEPKKIIVNLSPAGIKKEGAQFDLPIAVGIMAVSYTHLISLPLIARLLLSHSAC